MLYRIDWSLSDTFTFDEIEEIKGDNQDICVEDQEYFEVDDDLLNNIFEKVNSCNNTLGIKKKIVKRAAYILCLITNLQPFHENNRRTAYSVAMQFLRRNQLNIPLDNLEQEREVFFLLDKTKSKSHNDPTLCSEVEKFLNSRVISYVKYVNRSFQF